MGRNQDSFGQPPQPPIGGRATLLLGLAGTMFPIALLAWVVFNGTERVAATVLLASIGVGNLCWVIGSLTADGAKARALRAAAVGSSLLMAAAMVAWAVLQVTAFG